MVDHAKIDSIFKAELDYKPKPSCRISPFFARIQDKNDKLSKLISFKRTNIGPIIPAVDDVWSESICKHGCG